MVQIWAVAAISTKIEEVTISSTKVLYPVNEVDKCGSLHPCIMTTIEGNCHLTIHRRLCKREDTITMIVVIMTTAECGSQIMSIDIQEHRQ
jgi:hypothetical protein